MTLSRRSFVSRVVAAGATVLAGASLSEQVDAVQRFYSFPEHIGLKNVAPARPFAAYDMAVARDCRFMNVDPETGLWVTPGSPNAAAMHFEPLIHADDPDLLTLTTNRSPITFPYADEPWGELIIDAIGNVPPGEFPTNWQRSVPRTARDLQGPIVPDDTIFVSYLGLPAISRRKEDAM